MTATLTSTDIDNDRCPKCGAPIAGDIEDKERRISELEAENDRLRESVNAIRAEYLQHVFDEKARADQLEAERDAIRARTQTDEASQKEQR